MKDGGTFPIRLPHVDRADYLPGDDEALHAGKPIEQNVLIDEIWGKDTAITERVVDNQIANLRKKIESSPAAPRHLKSVRGIGYRFDLEDVTES